MTLARYKTGLDDVAAAVIAAFPKLSVQKQRISLTLYRLLAHGAPVYVEQLSTASGMGSQALRRMLGGWHGVERNPEGAVVAFWGLSILETKHRFSIGGRRLYTWCAWDTLFLPPLLGSPADVESTCPISGERISLRIGPTGLENAHPGTVMLSFLLPREADIEKSVTESFCCHVHFFASAETGQEWISTRPESFLLSLDDAWQIGARKNMAQFAAIHRDSSTSSVT